MPDFVTVATAADRKLMTKVFLVDGEGHEQTRSYEKGYLFNFSTPLSPVWTIWRACSTASIGIRV